jgi:protein phosphatase
MGMHSDATKAVVQIPSGSLVLAVGGTGSGKTTYFASSGFPVDQILSPDAMRVKAAGSDAPQHRNTEIFAILHQLCAMRMEDGITTVVDSTNLDRDVRSKFIRTARAHNRHVVAVRFDVDENTRMARNEARDNPRPAKAVHRHGLTMAQTGRVDYLLQEVDVVAEHTDVLDFVPWARGDHSRVSGPFAVIGDVHGNAELFAAMLERLATDHPDATAVQVGDLADRGADTPGCYRLAADMVTNGGHAVLGNHDNNLLQFCNKWNGPLDPGAMWQDVKGRVETIEREAVRTGRTRPFSLMRTRDTLLQFAMLPDGAAQLEAAVAFIKTLPHQLLLDDGKVLVVHGGVTPASFGRDDRAAQNVALYGTKTGQEPDTGYPTGRDSWVTAWCAAREQDPNLPLVLYGHIAYGAPEITDHTVGVDTGVGKHDGAQLTAAIVIDGKLDSFVTVSPAAIDVHASAAA